PRRAAGGVQERAGVAGGLRDVTRRGRRSEGLEEEAGGPVLGPSFHLSVLRAPRVLRKLRVTTTMPHHAAAARCFGGEIANRQIANGKSGGADRGSPSLPFGPLLFAICSEATAGHRDGGKGRVGSVHLHHAAAASSIDG